MSDQLLQGRGGLCFPVLRLRETPLLMLLLISLLVLWSSGRVRAESAYNRVFEPGAILQEQILRREVLGNIETLSRQLENYDLGAREARVLGAMATSMVISLIDGMASSAVSGYYSTVMQQRHWVASGMAVGAYSGLAMVMAYSLMYSLGWIEPLNIGTHLRFLLESALVGQAAGLVTGFISASSWSWLRTHAPGSLLPLISFGRTIKGFSALPQAEQDTYNSTVHYLLVRLAAGMGYGLLRSRWRSAFVWQQRQELGDSLARQKQTLSSLDDQLKIFRLLSQTGDLSRVLQNYLEDERSEAEPASMSMHTDNLARPD